MHQTCTHKGKASKLQTCASLNLMSGLDKSPVTSCSMYSNTRYMLHDNREVIRPSNLMTFGWSSLLRIKISRAINLTLSGSKLSNRTFFKATSFPVSRSRARNTLLYVPCPICTKICSSVRTHKNQADKNSEFTVSKHIQNQNRNTLFLMYYKFTAPLNLSPSSFLNQS